MKLLVITYNALMESSSNGRTMISLLDGYSPNEIANFCVTGVPDDKYCGSGFKVTNKDVLKSFFLMREYGRNIQPKSPSQTNSVLETDVYHGKKTPWKYYLREVLWKKGKWNGKRLKKWLKSQNFDCIVYMYGDGAALQNFSAFASEYLDIPLIVYSCEDYCFKDYNWLNKDNDSFFYKKYISRSRKATANLFKRASGLICNTDQLGRLYSQTYGISNVKTVMMSSEMKFIENTAVPDPQDMKIVYCGSLGIARNQALIDIAEALHEVHPDLKLDVYGRGDANTEKMFATCPYIRYYGFVNYEQVQQILREATLLTQTNTFDDYYAKDRRFGFSTKNADSLACGTPYFLYEKDNIVEMRFVKEHGCAFTATEKEHLIPVLKEALFDYEKRKEKVANAKKVTENYFNKEKNIATVHGLIEKCVAEKRK